MSEIRPEESTATVAHNRRVHMANERTFLAWIRTSIGVMAFGFVVERFALFMRQLSAFFGKRGISPGVQSGHGYSLIFGVILVGVGVIIAVLAFIRYKRMQKLIDEGSYRPSSGLDLLLTLAVVGTGLFLLGYLIRSL